jgi:hypothetical protein
MELNMTDIASISHWLALGLSLYVALRIFRDLADISQWIIKTSRDNTMSTFYHRHLLACFGVLAWGISLLTFYSFDSGYSLVYWPVSMLIVILFSAGYINPSIMMRSQQGRAHYYSIAEAKKVLAANTSLIVVESGQIARGHPDGHMLRPHVASSKNDPNVVMTYCGLTNMGIAYQPEIEGTRVDLGVMTQLENNLVMWDKNSGEPIQQFWGSLERTGPHGPHMPELASFRMPLWAFEKAYPNGEVFLNLVPSFLQNPFLAIYDRIIHAIFSHAITLQANREAPAFPTIDNIDKRLPNKQKIYGANVGDDYVAYTKEFIRLQGDIFNVSIGGQKILIAYHEKLDSVGMYINTEKGTVKEIDFGGGSKMGQLQRLPTMKSEAYWIVWQNFFPQTDVNRLPIST